MKPIVFEENGIQISIVEVLKNKVFLCEKCPSYLSDNCSLKKRVSEQQTPKELICTEIIVVFANMTDKSISIRSNYWEVVDTEGFSYGGSSLCDLHIKPRTVDPDRWEITPGTQVKFSLAFPQLNDKTNIVALIYSNRQVLGNNSARLYLRKPTKKVEALLLARDQYIANKKHNSKAQEQNV